MIMGQIFIMIIMIIVMIVIILGKFIGSKWLPWLLGSSWSSRKCSLDMSWPSSWPYAQETSWPFWTDHQGIIYLHFILVSWISSWRTNCFRESNSSRFSTLEIHYLSEWYFAFHASIMDLQFENQLFQRNQGSTLWRFISVVNDSLYFFVSWIFKWRNNCFRGTK